MNNTLEEYFNVNDTLDTLRGGNDTSEIEKIAVAVAKTAENAATLGSPVTSENTGTPSESSFTSSSSEGSSSNGSSDGSSSNGSSDGFETEEDRELYKELDKAHVSSNGVQTKLYFNFYKLFDVSRLSKLSSKVKSHYGINSLDNSPDNDYLKKKFTNSFMDVIYFCFLSYNANLIFWKVLFDGSEYSKFLQKRFNSKSDDYEPNYEFEDLDNKLYEILFNVNDNENNSYELIIEFIYIVKKKLSSRRNISIRDFFNHLKIENVYFDRLIKNVLKLVKLRIIEETEAEKAPENELDFSTYIETTLPDDIVDKNVNLLFKNQSIATFNLKEQKKIFFEELDKLISRETKIDSEQLNLRKNKNCNFFKYNLEFIENYFINYFDGFAFHTQTNFKFALTKSYIPPKTQTPGTNDEKPDRRTGRKLVSMHGDNEEKFKAQQWAQLLDEVRKTKNKDLISKIIKIFRQLKILEKLKRFGILKNFQKKGRQDKTGPNIDFNEFLGEELGEAEYPETVELNPEQQSLYDLLKKYIYDNLEFSLKQVLKLYYDIYILNDDLKGFKRFQNLGDLKGQVLGLESRIRIAYPEHRHNPEQLKEFSKSFVTSSKNDTYKITSEFHTLTFLICILLNVEIKKEGLDGEYNWGLGIVNTEGLKDYSSTDMSSVLKLCRVLNMIIQKLRRANNDEKFLNYFFSRHRDDNYNGWFRYKELQKFLKNCVEGETILDCLVSQNAFITEENKLSTNLAVYVALSVIHRKKSQIVSRPLPQTPKFRGETETETAKTNKPQKPILPSKKTIEEESNKKNEIIESVFSIYNRLSEPESEPETNQTGGYFNELNLEEIGGYFKKTTTSMYPPFFFTGNSGVVDVSSSSKKNDIDKSCFGPKQKGIFSKLFNEDSKRAPILRDKYMATLQESSGKNICYPTLMTDPYEAKYHEFYWGFHNLNFRKRHYLKNYNVINFYKLNLNDIQFAFNEEESDLEFFESLNGLPDTIDKYKGIYTEIKKKDGKLKTFGKGLLDIGKGIGTLGYLTSKDRKKKRNEEKLKFLKEYDESRERDENMPTNRYIAYMRRLCNLYFQQILFDEMITIEQSIKHLIEYYELRQIYLGLKSENTPPESVGFPTRAGEIINVTTPFPASVPKPERGMGMRPRLNSIETNAHAYATKSSAAANAAAAASVVSSSTESTGSTITSKTAAAPSISIAPNSA